MNELVGPTIPRPCSVKMKPASANRIPGTTRESLIPCRSLPSCLLNEPFVHRSEFRFGERRNLRDAKVLLDVLWALVANQGGDDRRVGRPCELDQGKRLRPLEPRHPGVGKQPR